MMGSSVSLAVYLVLLQFDATAAASLHGGSLRKPSSNDDPLPAVPRQDFHNGLPSVPGRWGHSRLAAEAAAPTHAAVSHHGKAAAGKPAAKPLVSSAGRAGKRAPGSQAADAVHLEAKVDGKQQPAAKAPGGSPAAAASPRSPGAHQADKPGGLAAASRPPLGKAPEASMAVERFAAAGWKEDPVIIGGVSDSGTRGVLAVLADCFGMSVCNHTLLQGDGSKADTGDDKFIHDAIGDLWRQVGSTIATLGVAPESLGAAGFDSSFKYTMMGAEWATSTGRRLCQSVSNSEQCAESGSRWSAGGKLALLHAPATDGLWGFKVPRTGAMVAVWDLIMPSHRFVHVTRDPRQTCYSDGNHASFDAMCKTVFVGDQRCKTGHSHELCYIYWGRFNLYIHNFYHRDASRTGRYFLAPIEDLVAAGRGGSERQQRLFARMRQSFGSSVPQERIEAAMQEESRHKGSMEAVFEDGRNRDWGKALGDAGFRRALCTFGYSSVREGRANASELEACQRPDTQ